MNGVEARQRTCHKVGCLPDTVSTRNADRSSLDILKHNEAIINLYIHEIAMHHSHNIDDFRPPYGVEEDNEEEPDYITPAHIDSLIICLDSIHKAFDAFIEMPVSTLRALPTLFFVRNSYAAVALIKMFTAVSAEGSKFGSVFKPKDLKVEYYLDAMNDKMKRAAEGGQSRIALKFTLILSMLKSWQAKRAAGAVSGKDKSMLVKAVTAGWEKLQESKMASWSSTASTTNANAKSQHSGLQMLSEVAVGNNNSSSSTTTTTTSDPAAAAALATTTSTTQAPWDAQLVAYAEMQPQQSQQLQQQQPLQLELQQQQQQQQQPPLASTSTIPPDFFSQGQMADIDSFAFTAQELGALGNMMDDPGWLSFGLESGGWAM